MMHMLDIISYVGGLIVGLLMILGIIVMFFAVPNAIRVANIKDQAKLDKEFEQYQKELRDYS